MANFGQGDGPIFLEDIVCRGSELRLVDCPRRSNGNDCKHKKDVVVLCAG